MLTLSGSSVCGEEVDLSIAVFVCFSEKLGLAGPRGNVGFNEDVSGGLEGGFYLLVGGGADVRDDDSPGWGGF